MPLVEGKGQVKLLYSTIKGAAACQHKQCNNSLMYQQCNNVLMQYYSYNEFNILEKIFS